MVQNHVTWGKNTTTVFNTPATPAKSTSLFGQPSPAPTTFGASPASSTPSTFSFGSAPVATPQSGIMPSFATTTTTTPTTASNFFSPTTNTTTTTGIGIGTPQQPQNPAMSMPMSSSLGAPQQAALQAHLNASMAQESSRLESQLLQLHAAYSPYQTTVAAPAAPTSSFSLSTQPAQPTITLNATCRFQHIYYDAMTPTQRMEKMSLGGNYPPKPSHISHNIWNQALSQNPNPEEFLPVLITSATGLHSRLVSQQSKMALLESYLDKLENVLHERQSANIQIENRLNGHLKRELVLKQKLMTVMQKVDMCRGKNVPLQPTEMELMNKLQTLFHTINNLGKYLEKVKSEAEVYQRQLILLEQERGPLGMGLRRHGGGAAAADAGEGVILNDVDKSCVYDVLNKQGNGLEELRKILKKDERDLGIIKTSLSNKRF